MPIFPSNCGEVPVTWLNRSVLFVRPGLFAVYDQVQKSATQPQVQPVMHLWLPTAPSLVGGDPRKVSLDNGGGRLQIAAVLPANSTVSTVAAPRNETQGPGVSSWHYSATLANPSPAYQAFLTVLRAGDATPAYAFPAVSAITGTGVNGTLVAGLLATEGTTPVAMLFADSGTRAVPASVQYSVPAATTRHFVAKLKPSTAYAIGSTVTGGTRTVTVTENPGGTPTDTGGVLAFTL